MKKYAGFVIVAQLLVLMAGCSVSPLPGLRGLSQVSVTPEQEVQLGRQSTQQLIQLLGGVYPDQALNDYVSLIGHRLLPEEAKRDQSFQFKVVNHSVPNAIAVPGGFVLITRGLLLSLENEAQLVSILAHEIGHLDARHGIEEIQRSAAGAASGSRTGESEYVRPLIQFREGTERLLRKVYTPGEELEADRLGIDAMIRGGYSLQGIAELMEVLARKAGSQTSSEENSGILHRHPSTPERQLARREYLMRFYPNDLGSDGPDPSAFKQHLERLSLSSGAYELYDRARYAEKMGQEAEALEHYHRAIQEAPQGLLLSSLGMAYLRAEDLIPARRYLQQAVTVDPDYYQSRLGLGYIAVRNQHWVDAITQLTASLALLPTAQGIYLLAEAEEGRGNIVRARQLYQTLVQVDGKTQLGQAAAARLKQLPR